MINLWWQLVKFGFRLLYNELAFTYDLISQLVSLGQWRCWQRAALHHLPIPTDGVILELAHGTGNLQIDLQQKGYHAIGVDLSPHMGHIAQAKLRRHQIQAGLIQADAKRLPFPDHQFAAVVCTFPTDFIFMKETLAEIRRILHSRGKLVIVPGAKFTGKGLIQGFLEQLYRITGQRNHETFASITPLFEAAGFTIELIEKTCKNSRVMVIVAEVTGEN